MNYHVIRFCRYDLLATGDNIRIRLGTTQDLDGPSRLICQKDCSGCMSSPLRDYIVLNVDIL